MDKSLALSYFKVQTFLLSNDKFELIQLHADNINKQGENGSTYLYQCSMKNKADRLFHWFTAELIIE